MASSLFGAFRETADTRRRPRKPVFPPRFRIGAELQEDLLRIEGAERELRLAEADAATARRILRDALSRNTYGTVSIEGNPLTLDQVQSLLQFAPSPASAIGAAEQDVLNLAAFLSRLEEEEIPRFPADLARLHARLFEGTVRDPGRFKDVQNFIGRNADRVVVYVPTPPERVERELAEALTWFHASDAHPLVRVAVFFHEFQSIHPFIDGNGRLGRAIAALEMHHLGYVGVRYATVDFAINEDREAYYDALARTQGGEWDLSAWIRYFVGVLRGAFEDAVQRFAFKDAVPPGLDARALDVAMWIARRDRAVPGRRVKVADVHAAFPSIPRRTLQRDLGHLVEAGVLVLEGRGRGAAYVLGPRLARRS